MSNASLTPVIVHLRIEDSGGGALFDTQNENSGFVVSEVSVVHRINDISEARIGIGFKTVRDHDQIRQLFPGGSSSGVSYARASIEVTGSSSSVSAISRTHTLFTGYIVGYRHSKGAHGSRFFLNARGNMHLMSLASVGSVGFHPSSPFAWNVTSFSSFQSQNTAALTVDALMRGCLAQPSGFELFKYIFRQFSAAVQAASGPPGNFHRRAFEIAKKAFSRTSEQQQALEADLNTVTEAGNVNIPWRNDRGPVESIVYTALSNLQATFWDLLLHLCQYFGLVFTNAGTGSYIAPFAPLASSGAENYVEDWEITSIEISDFPFGSPTRVILSVPLTNTTAADPVGTQDIVLYPEEEDLTEQERKTGVKTLYMNAPAFLSYIQHESISSPYNTLTRQTSYDRMANAGAVSSVRQAIGSMTEQNVRSTNTYAEYVLTTQKYKQRLGSAVCRYRPDLIAGFPCRIQDALLGTDIYAFINEVTHTLNANSRQTLTQLGLSYIHYPGEAGDLSNPLYPGQDTGALIENIASMAGVYDIAQNFRPDHG